MAGIEVVGILLSSLPLVISAVEHYRDGLQPLKEYTHYDRTLRGLRIRLKIQQNLFEGTLKRLLISELSQYELQSLFPTPDVPAQASGWGSEEIEEKLRRRLGIQYQSFMDVVIEMETSMAELMYKLDLDMSGKPKWKTDDTNNSQSNPRIGWEWRKVRRTFSKREREELLGKFERFNNNLSVFVQNHEVLAPQATESYAKPLIVYFEQVRTHAAGLFDILQRSWNCSCSLPHMVNIRLDPLKAVKKDPVFQVKISYPEEHGDSGPVKEMWKEAAINLVEENHGQQTEMTSTSRSSSQIFTRPGLLPSRPSSSNILPTGNIDPRVEQQKKTAKVLRFLTPKSSSPSTPIATASDVGLVHLNRSFSSPAAATTVPSSSQTISSSSASIASFTTLAETSTVGSFQRTQSTFSELSTSSSSTSISYHLAQSPSGTSSPTSNSTATLPTESPSYIECLCDAIRKAPKSQDHIGVLAKSTRGRRASISSIHSSSDQNSTILLHLESLLPSKRSPPTPSPLPPGTELSRAQRLSIGVALSSAVLQFYHSAWLDELWSKSDISFFFSGIDDDHGLIIGPPHVSRSFRSSAERGAALSSSDADTHHPHTSASDFQASLIINRTLFALGIVLIELCLNKRFEDLRPPLQAGQAAYSIADDYSLAQKQIDAVYREGGMEYGYVCQRCLRCEFRIQDSKKRLDVDTFRHLVYEGVVAPLEEDLKKYSLWKGGI